MVNGVMPRNISGKDRRAGKGLKGKGYGNY